MIDRLLPAPVAEAPLELGDAAQAAGKGSEHRGIVPSTDGRVAVVNANLRFGGPTTRLLRLEGDEVFFTGHDRADDDRKRTMRGGRLRRWKIPRTLRTC